MLPRPMMEISVVVAMVGELGFLMIIFYVV